MNVPTLRMVLTLTDNSLVNQKNGLIHKHHQLISWFIELSSLMIDNEM